MNAFAVLGLAIDGVGLALVAAALLTGDEPCWALLIGGVTLSIIGAFVFIIGRQAGPFHGLTPRLASTGLPANAHITEVSPLGLVVNGSPVLRFGLQVSHQAHDYPVEVRQAAPRSAVPTLVPGTRLAVRVDPADPQRVAIDWSQPPEPGPAPAGLTPSQSRPAPSTTAPAPEEAPTAEELLARGRRGMARITGAREMGDAVALGVIPAGDERAGAKMAMLDLEVKLPGREPYPARVMTWVPKTAGPLEPGRPLVVAVDREDPEHRLAIDWESTPGGL